MKNHQLSEQAKKFRDACVEQNSMPELRFCLDVAADKQSMSDWGLTEDEYFCAIEAAIDELGDL